MIKEPSSSSALLRTTPHCSALPARRPYRIKSTNNQKRRPYPLSPLRAKVGDHQASQTCSSIHPPPPPSYFLPCTLLLPLPTPLPRPPSPSPPSFYFLLFSTIPPSSSPYVVASSTKRSSHPPSSYFREQRQKAGEHALPLAKRGDLNAVAYTLN